MQKILIPTDLSSNAFKAIQYATELFKHGHAQIFILHTFADEVYDAKAQRPDADFEELKDEVCQKIDAALVKLKKEIQEFSPNPRHSIQCITEFGLLVDVVNKWVDKENIDIVVMGTKGQTDDKQITFGSNTLQVVKYVKCPVLAIPEACDIEWPKNILFSTDFLLPYKRRELKLLANLARHFGAWIHVLYVSKFSNLSLRQQDNKAFLEAMFSGNHIKFHQTDDGEVTQAVNSFVAENDMDMLVMVNTRHSYLENVLYQSTIEKIGLHINIPFLVMQNLFR